MQFSHLELIIFISLFQLILLVVVLVQKNWKSLSNRMFVLFLFAQLVSLSNSLLFLNWDYSMQHLSYLFYLSPPFWFIYGPSIYLFICAETKESAKFNTTDLIHFLPALLVALYFIIVFHIYPISHKQQLLNEGVIYNYGVHQVVGKAMIIHVMIYIMMAVVKLEQFARTQKALPSKSFQARISWNRFIIYVYMVTCIMYDITVFFEPFSAHPGLRDAISLMFFTLYFTLILYRALVSSHFAEPKSPTQVLKISKKEAAQLMQKLEEFMASSKPYLEFNLTLGKLSDMVNEKERQISVVLNQVRNQNFQDYINYYRIEEAKKQLAEGGKDKKTILEVLYACGFNSKSAFNLAFKKYTGTSPTQFRKLASA